MVPALPAIPDRAFEAARALDKLYIPTRYPNGFAQGAPGQFYDTRDSREAIEHAAYVIAFCKGHID